MADTSSSTPAAPAAPAAPASRSRLKLFLTIALVVAGAAAGLAWWMSSARQTTDDAQIDGHIVPLAARVQGTVLAVHVKDNQQVKAGDVLVELDPRDFQLAVSRAEADLADARAAADEAASGVPVTQAASTSNLSGARAGVQEASAAIDAAKSEVNAATARRAEGSSRMSRSVQ